MVSLDSIYSPIRKDMGKIEDLIKTALLDDTVREFREIHSLLANSPGKRLRPAIVALCAYASIPKARITPQIREKMRRTAAAFEIIHMATLVHDDVMDSSLLRHKKPTINAGYDDNIAICSGDFLFARALDLLSKANDSRITSIAAKATKEVCEGQVLQVWRRHDFGMSMKDYDAIINRKTAALFGAACEAGGLCAGKKGRLSLFGIHFGRGFQMIDDYLDIISDEKTLGKRPGENLRAGELTLPVMLLLQAIPHSKRPPFAKKCMKDMGFLKKSLLEKQTGARVRVLVAKEMRSAEQSLDALPKSPYLDSLHGLLDLSISRLKG